MIVNLQIDCEFNTFKVKLFEVVVLFPNIIVEIQIRKINIGWFKVIKYTKRQIPNISVVVQFKH